MVQGLRLLITTAHGGVWNNLNYQARYQLHLLGVGHTFRQYSVPHENILNVKSKKLIF